MCCVWTVTGNVHVKNEIRISNATDRMRHNVRGVTLTPASRRRYKIGLPVEGLNIVVLIYSTLSFIKDSFMIILDTLVTLSHKIMLVPE